MIAGMQGELYNVDVDLLGLQVGRMVRRARGGNVSAVCADVANLPFPYGWFDAIVVVASLHHFPDPTAALRSMRERLAPTGFICLLCEPVGHIWPGAVDAAFLTELEAGINEQTFSVAEYMMIFRDAGLRVEQAVVDAHSLKARLVSPAIPAKAARS
jgi:SAM-dependent methyltransferase